MAFFTQLVNKHLPGFRLFSGSTLNAMSNVINQLGALGTTAVVTTADDGTTQTLTATMIAGGSEVYHTSAGGSTPSLTLPLGTALEAFFANLNLPAGMAWYLRIINTNSGIATIVTNTGWTLTGTLTLAAGSTRDFVITRTSAGVFTAVSVGTGTTS